MGKGTGTERKITGWQYIVNQGENMLGLGQVLDARAALPYPANQPHLFIPIMRQQFYHRATPFHSQKDFMVPPSFWYASNRA